MTQASIKLPYFDFLLTEFDDGNVDVEKAFGRHVHWGYWQNPQAADGTVEDFAQAAEALSRMITDAADIKSGMKVLDAGCGFGGTIASMNERFSPVELVGINIDGRQLQRARTTLLPVTNNSLEFVQGNACELPFADQSFDAVVAVECIFHFPSREAFFREAARVLKPGGKLALSDFIQPQSKPFWMENLGALIQPIVGLIYGRVNSCAMTDYAAIAEQAGLHPCFEQDITAETMPTYAVLSSLIKTQSIKSLVSTWINQAVAEAQRSHRILYKVLAYEKR